MKVRFYQWKLPKDLPGIMKSLKYVTLGSSKHCASLYMMWIAFKYSWLPLNSPPPPALTSWINYRTCSTRMSGPCLMISWREISWRELLPSGSSSFRWVNRQLRWKMKYQYTIYFQYVWPQENKPRRYKFSTLLSLSIWFVYTAWQASLSPKRSKF